MKRPKIVPITASGKNNKEVRLSPEAPIPKPVWAFSRADLRGKWCWSKLDSTEVLQIVQRFKNLESHTWHEIKQMEKAKNHHVDVGAIIKEAQNSFKKICSEEEADYLFSLRITGPIRVWGLLKQEKFYILWCDPKHEIYPTDKS